MEKKFTRASVMIDDDVLMAVRQKMLDRRVRTLQRVLLDGLRLWMGDDGEPRTPRPLPSDLTNEEISILTVVVGLLRSKRGAVASSVRKIVNALDELQR